MAENIAVIVDHYGAPAPLTACASVCIFEKADLFWEVTKELPINLSFDGSLSKIRAEVLSLAQLLGSCHIIAGLGINGIAFNVFNKLGFKIFDITALNQEVLDGIAEELLQESINQNSNPILAAPVETDTPGYYELDLIALQRTHPEVSSKKALQPFLKDTPFVSLTLRCSHLPPWLELDRSLEIASAYDKGTLISVIRKKKCT